MLREFFGWSEARLARYRPALESIVARSGGQVVTPTEHVSDCQDSEDNRILEVALTAGALLIVSSDDHLLQLSPWRVSRFWTLRRSSNASTLASWRVRTVN